VLYADYSARALTGLELQAAGFGGAVRYAGTPGRTKNTTAAEVSSLHASGIDVHGVFENSTTDYTGGFNAGVTNARALLADAGACGITGVLFMSADQHLTTAQLPVWQQYLQGAKTVLGSRTGAYGFSEAVSAAKAVGVTNLWQCGSRSTLIAGANLYQRNTGGTTVSGIAVDINDLITPFSAPAAPQPRSEDMGRVINASNGYQGWSDGNLLRGMTATEAAADQTKFPAYPMDAATWDAAVARTTAWDARLATPTSVTLTDAQFTVLTQDVAAGISGAVGTLNLSVSTSDQAAIASAVATELAARLSA
jgi:hypothetical protein